VLVFHLAPTDDDDGARVILRPSGTEPKVKLYVELQGARGLSPAQQAGVDARVAELAEAARTTLLG
jgi:phosphomannomutase